MLKAYKYRIYPNNLQKEQINKTFGCVRFVYNNVLAYKKEVYEKEHKTLTKLDLNNYCNRELKIKYEWLREVDKFAITNSVYNVDKAYNNFFKGKGGYPKFKSKKSSTKSYTTNYTNGNINVDFDNNKIKLPKLKQVKAKVHRKFNGIIKSATVFMNLSGKYYVSILVETSEVTIKSVLEKEIGIDLGIKDLCITSNGDRYENPKTIKKYEKKLKRIQRNLSRKEKGSNNFKKLKQRLAKVHEKIKDIRIDYLHKVSYKIVNENQVIVSENLQVKNMMKNHTLASSISDVSWYELTRQLAYKSNWYGRKYIKIDTFYASSQICNVCGYKNTDMKNLHIRNWKCPNCDTNHDRDVNAAKNILQEGLRLAA